MGGREEPRVTSRVTMLRGAVIQEDWGWEDKTHGLSPACREPDKLGTLPPPHSSLCLLLLRALESTPCFLQLFASEEFKPCTQELVS